MGLKVGESDVEYVQKIQKVFVAREKRRPSNYSYTSWIGNRIECKLIIGSTAYSDAHMILNMIACNFLADYAGDHFLTKNKNSE